MIVATHSKNLRHIWNWVRCKRILETDHVLGRVIIRTGHNSSSRNSGGQWYLLRHDRVNGPPPLPICSRGRLDKPIAFFHTKRMSENELKQARQWYEKRFGNLKEHQDLELVCVYDPSDNVQQSRTMQYRPNEIFEIEHPWLSSQYDGPTFTSYFGTWYGSGMLQEHDLMDFEIFWDVGTKSRLLPKWGATW